MVWFSAYEVIEAGRRRTVPIAAFETDAWPNRTNGLLALHAAITAPRPALTLGDRVLRFDQPTVAAILNVTPDSFSDGGKLTDPAAAAEAGFDLSVKGATMIDVGGESTRPGAPLVWEGDEVKRVVPGDRTAGEERRADLGRHAQGRGDGGSAGGGGGDRQRRVGAAVGRPGARKWWCAPGAR